MEVNAMKKLKKIDIHVHSIPESFVKRPDGSDFATPEQLREMYDQINVEKGLLLPVAAHIESVQDTISLREAKMMVEQYPETLGWWFCNINPMMYQNSPHTDLSCFINQLKEKGAKGIGEFTGNLYFDDPYVENMFYHAEKCRMPVTIHIGNPGGGDYGLIDEIGLPRLEKTLQKFPNLIILGHSQKFWAEIGGGLTEEERAGYPTGKVKPGGRLVELMRNYPNLYGDMSAGSGCNAMMRDPEFAYSFMEEFQDRLFFGTDICDPRNITNPMLKLSSFLDEAMENGKISYSAYEKISRENALRLLEREI